MDNVEHRPLKITKAEYLNELEVMPGAVYSSNSDDLIWQKGNDGVWREITPFDVGRQHDKLFIPGAGYFVNVDGDNWMWFDNVKRKSYFRKIRPYDEPV